jgi:hypothetical protein
MPAGSTVWMKGDAGIAPDADLDDFVGSNLPGIAPPNGIPTTTITGTGTYATGFAEILPDRIRTFISSGLSVVMHASFVDTYTVGGTAAGPVQISFELRVTGTMRTVQTGAFHQLLAGNVQAEIGTWNPDPTLVLEGSRVTPFVDQASAEARSAVVDRFVQDSVPLDITATYTKTVNVGDVFDIAYCVRSATSKGEIDLLNTGTLAFVLPPGVTLTSSLAQSIPEPAVGGALLAPAGLALVARRRRSARCDPAVTSTPLFGTAQT